MKTYKKTIIKILAAITASAAIAIPLVTLSSCESQPNLPTPESISISGGLSTFDTIVGFERHDTKNPFIIKQEPIQSNPFVNWHIQNIDGTKAPDFIYIDEQGLLGITNQTIKAESYKLQVFATSVADSKIISNKLDLTVIVSGSSLNDCKYVLSNDNKHYILSSYDGAGGVVKMADTINGLPVKEIGENAFKNCDLITNFVISEQVEVINDFAFIGCTKLSEINITANIASIGFYAFGGCNLTSINIDAKNKNYIKATNLGTTCQAVLEITTNGIFSDNTKVVGSLACGELVLPNKTEAIAADAFGGCSGLTGTLTIPASVTSIGDCAFKKTNFTSTSIEIGNTKYCMATNLGATCQAVLEITTNGIFNSDSKVIGSLAFGELVLPSDLAKIANNAFWGCSGLTGTFAIPATVTSIGNNAFSECSNLFGSLVLPTIHLGEFAFYNCVKLNNVEFPKRSGANVLSEGVFAECYNLSGELDLSMFIEISKVAFKNCDNITKVFFSASTGAGFLDSSFEGCYSLAEISINANNHPFGIGATQGLFLGTDVFKNCNNFKTVNLLNSINVGTNLSSIKNDFIKSGASNQLEVIRI